MASSLKVYNKCEIATTVNPKQGFIFDYYAMQIQHQPNVTLETRQGLANTKSYSQAKKNKQTKYQAETEPRGHLHHVR